jgi:hypothetical protein
LPATGGEHGCKTQASPREVELGVDVAHDLLDVDMLGGDGTEASGEIAVGEPVGWRLVRTLWPL